MDITARTQGMAAIMMMQSLILALIERGVLSGEDVLSALEDTIEAHRSAAADGDLAFHSAVLRVLTTATEEVAS